jgi:hypothetical protein
MAIGTEIKVGFDASAVRKGFAGLGGMFAGAMRGFRQVGIGAARDVGARMTDLLGRVLMAVPDGIKETMDWAGDLDDMATQTRVSVGRLVLLEEALRLSGAQAKDTSLMISRLANNLEDARNSTGPARDALNKLGFLAEDFANIPIDKAFEMIGKRAAELPDDFRGLEGIMFDLFGGKMGGKLIRFFRNFDAQTKQASKNVGDLAKRMDANAAAYADAGDKLDRFTWRWKELMAMVIDAGADDMIGWADGFFESMSPEKIRATFAFLREEVAGIFKGDGISGMFRGIGRSIGEGIAESLKGMSAGSLIKGMFTGGATASTGTGGSFDKLVAQGTEQTGLLRQIAMKKGGGWA